MTAADTRAPTPRDLFIAALRRFADRDCLTADGKLWTYADVDGASDRLANALAARGIGAGDVVALYMRNAAEYVVADMAIFKLGATKTPMNEMLSASDVAFILGHCGAKAVIVHTSFHQIVAAERTAFDAVPCRLALADDQATLPGFEDYETAVEGAAEAPPPAPDIAPSDIALILYTGGTTGRSKGVAHRQDAIAVNLFAHQMYAEIAGDERLLLTSPLPHAAQVFYQTAMLVGAHMAIRRGFDPEAVLKAIADDGATWTFMVPTMIYRLLDHPGRQAMDLSALRTIFYGAAPITSGRLKEGIAVFGPVFKQLYGQSEAPNFIAALDKPDHLTEAFQTSCGKPVIFCETTIRDAAGAPLPDGEVGEICVRGPYTLARYHDDPEKTEEAFWRRPDGDWLRTGDVGWRAATGHLYLVDRAKDMIISGGMNVYSTEVENVVQDHPDVAQVMVIGVPDDDWGEAVVAFVVPARAGIDAEAVRVFARERLAAYKAPKRVELLDEIPVTAYGKPDKKAIRARYWAGTERAIN